MQLRARSSLPKNLYLYTHVHVLLTQICQILASYGCSAASYLGYLLAICYIYVVLTGRSNCLKMMPYNQVELRMLCTTARMKSTVMNAPKTVPSFYLLFLRPLANIILYLITSSRTVILNTMNSGMSPEYSSISKFYWASRLSCCLQKSIAYAVRRKYSISNGKAVRGLHFSHTNRANITDRDLTLQCDNTVNDTTCIDQSVILCKNLKLRYYQLIPTYSRYI